ncbi:helix-hairpin-helix domain-containing protein [Globicatella sanguinis]|uniref:helix-hairpin-helix domain-containing protein n=1 Tax=Globicatella sanguinis TaxID=13076 RepID=UPI00082458A7|nr:helix-hairpin-helix domain-containing protein [Globicatella sanguinis]MDK7630295.1 helix-hairpin-helix domain-containing protein [Globicatella sanguinis]WIK67225.1 helix-hairpin-helix domain-containing protein [Globicatella sanguinis]WKT56630.1 helix-hairpin-helix domain-containing protein [Globicatella sanguinis]
MNKISDIFKENKVVLVIFILGIVYFLFQNQPETVSFLSESGETRMDEALLTMSTTETTEITTQEMIIYVDVKGEVRDPGVYQLSNGARVMDAIESAGGLTNEADEDQLNLALLLSDQMVIVVPNINQTLEEEYSMVNHFANEIDEDPYNELKININVADVAELTLLPGIGEKKAQAIIDYREENGSYQTIEDLMNVSGIGQKTFDKLSSMISVR